MDLTMRIVVVGAISTGTLLLWQVDQNLAMLFGATGSLFLISSQIAGIAEQLAEFRQPQQAAPTQKPKQPATTQRRAEL